MKILNICPYCGKKNCLVILLGDMLLCQECERTVKLKIKNIKIIDV